MIIKNIFSNGDDNNSSKKASANSETGLSLKFCNICQAAFKKGTDNIKLAYCYDCDSNERVANASYWKQVFASKKANSLSPQMQELADKLASNQSLVEGKKITRDSNGEFERSERNLNQILKSQASKEETSFKVVKAQVREMLPSILSELGLSKKVNADLLVDLIVPIKIASPIVNELAGRSALKSIIHEAIEHLDVNRDMKKEAAFLTHGKTPQISDINFVMNEGIRRASYNNDDNRFLALRKKADPNNIPPSQDDNSFAPPQNIDDMNGDMNSNMDEDGQDGQNGPLPVDPPIDSNYETGPSADVSDSEELSDSNSNVQHLDDDQADSLISGETTPTDMDAPQDQTSSNFNPSSTPSQPNVPNQDMSNMPDEGIGTHSGGDNYVPDASDLSEMPDESSVHRVSQAGLDSVTRVIGNLVQKQAKKSALSLFSYAGKISKQLPVQSVKLSKLDLSMITNHPPINKMAALYSDNSKLAWNYYLTDSGYLMVSAENSFHAKSLEAFADFVETDSTFTKWASLPNELKPELPPALDDNHSVADMTLPQSATPGGTPGFNDVPETHLDSSQDNSMSQPDGMMNDQEAIFDNNGNDENNYEPENPLNDEAVVNTASDLMPHIASMFPDDSDEEHQEMAITAAIDILTKKVIGEDESIPDDITTNNIINKALKKKAGDLGVPILNGIGGGIHNVLSKIPNEHIQSLLSKAKDYMGVAKHNENGNGLLGDISKHDISQSLFGPSSYKTPHESHTAQLIAQKASNLMPYINDVYASESNDVKVSIALEAAFNFLKTAAPAVMDAPSETSPESSSNYSRGGGGAKQAVSGNDLFDMIPKSTVHNFVKGLAPHHPEAASVAGNEQASHDFARGLANGKASVGGNSSKIPSYSMPKSTFDRLPAKKEKAEEKLTHHFNSWGGQVGQHLQNLRDSGSTGVKEDGLDSGPVTPETKEKWENSTAFNVNREGPKDRIEENTSNNDSIPTGKSPIPTDKQRLINQTVMQLNHADANQSELMNPDLTDGQRNEIKNSPNVMMQRLHTVTPHLSDDQRKQMLSSHLHGLHDDVGQAMKQQTAKDIGFEDDKIDNSKPIDTSNTDQNDGKNKAIDRRLERHTEINNHRPDGSRESKELPGDNTTRENWVKDTGTEKNRERDGARTDLREQTPVGDLAKKLKQEKDDELARKIQEEQSKGRVASKLNDLILITADLNQEDFELSVEALLDLGYSEDAIMTEAERRYSE